MDLEQLIKAFQYTMWTPPQADKDVELLNHIFSRSKQ